jgi:hypothetical protein
MSNIGWGDLSRYFKPLTAICPDVPCFGQIGELMPLPRNALMAVRFVANDSAANWLAGILAPELLAGMSVEGDHVAIHICGEHQAALSGRYCRRNRRRRFLFPRDLAGEEGTDADTKASVMGDSSPQEIDGCIGGEVRQIWEKAMRE